MNTNRLILGALALGLSTQGALAQLPVSQEPENRNVILEEYTGIYCGFCPDGHRIGSEYADANPEDVFLINIHTGSYANPSGGDPDYRTSFGPALMGQTDLAGFPAGTINRHVFAGYSQISGTAQSRGSWVTTGNQILAQSSYVNIAADASIDGATREMTVDLEAYFTGSGAPSSMKINVAVVQNNIAGYQSGMSYNPSQINGDGTYNHQHMLRHLITGQWGDEITTTTMGTLVEKTYTWTVPAALNGIELVLSDLKVIVFISEGNQEIITGAEARTGVAGIENEEVSTFALSAYPNPASELVNVSLQLDEAAAVSFEVVNLLGEVVAVIGTQNLNAGTYFNEINVADLTDGVYLIKTTVNDKVQMTKIVVRK